MGKSERNVGGRWYFSGPTLAISSTRRTSFYSKRKSKSRGVVF